MDRKTDVLILGAGVVGVSAARALALRGRKVLVVDRGPVGSGCSRGNAGLLVPSHSIPMAAPGVIEKGMKWMFSPDSPFYIKFRFSLELFSWLLKFRAACREERMRAAIPVLRDLHRASAALYDSIAGPDVAYARRGLLLVYRSDAGLEEGRREAALLRGYGLPSDELDPAAARARIPALKEGVRGAILFPEDGCLDPSRFLDQAAAEARSRGAEFLTETEVLGVETAGRRITGVRTAAGSIAADEVVLATGSWSPQLARPLGLRLPVQPAKGYSITMKAPAAPPSLPLLLMEAKVGVTPMGPILRLAGTLELAGLDLSINERRVEAIRRGAREYVDGLEGLPELEVWRGLRPCTPDGLPVLGRPAAWDNLILATGHAMIGLSLGPISGELVAQLAARETPAIDLALLHPDRFNC